MSGERKPYSQPQIEDITEFSPFPFVNISDPRVGNPRRLPKREYFLLLNMWYAYVRKYNRIPGGALWHVTVPERIFGFEDNQQGFRGPFTPSPNGRPNLTNNPSAMAGLIRAQKLETYKIKADSPLLRVEVGIPDPMYLGDPRVTTNGFKIDSIRPSLEKTRLDFEVAQEIPPENYRRFDLLLPGEELLFLGATAQEAYESMVTLGILPPPPQEQVPTPDEL